MTTASVAQTANIACNGDMCAGEVKDASVAIPKLIPATQNLVSNTITTAQNVGVPVQKGITAIGNRADTLWVSQNLPGVRTLVNVQNWTPKMNIRWLDSALRRGDEIWKVTDPKVWIEFNKRSFYFQEIRYIDYIGKGKIIDMLLKK
ncbi:MAG: hypothetical protein FD147_434 [Chloroflexi bacterium]|nr:MAG: hypothetical protein FD147_434 [Chloroflexota bacterium]